MRVIIRERVRSALRRPHRDERGMTYLAVTVLVFPALLVAIGLIIQVALLGLTNIVVATAADRAASEAARFDGTAVDGNTTAEQFLGSLGNELLTGTTIDVDRGAETVTVTIEGSVKSLVPFLSPTVSSTSTSPVERYVPPVGP